MIKNTALLLFTIVSTTALLTACSSSSSKVKDTLGMGRQSPDEFAVVERAPLTLPPSYDLVEPRPGAPRPQETSTTDQARALLTGQDNIQTGNMSATETLLVQQAGGASANPAIRDVLNQEYGVVPEGAKSERTIDKLNPLKSSDAKEGKVIDPAEEADALREKGVNAPKPVVPETSEDE